VKSKFADSAPPPQTSPLETVDADDVLAQALELCEEEDSIDILETIRECRSWPSRNPAFDAVWSDFAEAEVKQTGLPREHLVRPFGHGPLVTALNYAPLNETVFQEFGTIADASESCIRVLATKLHIPCTQESISTTAYWMETIFRRDTVPARTNQRPEVKKQPYESILTVDAIARHRQYRNRIWAECDCPIGLNCGKESRECLRKTRREEFIAFSDVEMQMFRKPVDVFLRWEKDQVKKVMFCRSSLRLVRWPLQFENQMCTRSCRTTIGRLHNQKRHPIMYESLYLSRVYPRGEKTRLERAA